MDAGLTLELLSTTDVCLRVGQNLCERYKNIRGTSGGVDDLHSRMEDVWLDIEFQLGIVESSPEAVPVILREHMVNVLYQLQFHLHTAYKNFENTTDKKGRSVMRRIWFAFFPKGSLKRDISALEKWRGMFGATFSVLFIQNNPEPNPIPSDEAI